MISHDKELVYDFPTLGNYEITVVGDYGWGSFSTMKMVMAECKGLRFYLVAVVLGLVCVCY